MKLLITADWHIRKTKPVCRTDEDWMETQSEAVEQVFNLAVKYKTDVCIVGDIFHSNSDTDFECLQLVQNFAKKLKENKLRLFILAGNHDLLYHSSLNMNRSAVGILFRSENIFPLSKLGENVSATNFDEEVNDAEIVFRHILTFESEKDLPPNVEAKTAKDLLKETPSAKWVFTGDNHHNFHYEKNGRHVINPGCLLRQAVDFIDYEPCVFLVDTEKEKVLQKFIIDNKEFVDNSYILKQEEREERIGEFVESLKNTKSISLDFLENVKVSLMNNKLSKELVSAVEELLL